MLAALNDDQGIAFDLFACDVPGSIACAGLSADAKPLPLPRRVVHQPLVFSNDSSIGCFHRAFVAGEITRQKLAERPFADKTNTGAITFRMDRQASGIGQFAHLRFVQFAQREHCLRQGRRGHRVQEVALVLAGVYSAQQARAWAPIKTCVMTRRQAAGAKPSRMRQADPKLDFAIAQNIGIGRAAGTHTQPENAQKPGLDIRR